MPAPRLAAFESSDELSHVTPRFPSLPPIVVATELRVYLHRGTAWVHRAFGYDYWSTILGTPTSVVLIVRTERAHEVPLDFEPLEGPLVRIVILPTLRPWVSLPTDITCALKRLWHLDQRGILLLRMPGIVATLLLLVALIKRRRFAVQMLGDPLDVAFKADIGGRPGRFAGLALGAAAAIACRRASAVSYVTDAYLQKRYPSSARVAARAIGDVLLQPNQIRPARASDPVSKAQILRVVTVASLDQTYKRLDLLIEAAATLETHGWEIEVHVAGAGRLLETYRQLAAQKGLAHPVVFHGLVDHSDVLELLTSADLFVLCSDTEGMPRAMIEAMAAGTPCIGSAVGGVPELLPPYALFTPGSLESLVGALSRHLISPGLRTRSSADMVKRAQAFHPDTLQHLRSEFIQDLAVNVADDGCRIESRNG